MGKRWTRTLWGKCLGIGVVLTLHPSALLGLPYLMERLGVWIRGE